MIHTLTAAPRDMRTTGRSVQISNDLFNTQMLEPRILRVQPDPGLTIERLTGMHVSAGEIVMEIPTQITPPAVIDRGHQATQQLNSNHALRLLALIDTYRGPSRIQVPEVVPDQSGKWSQIRLTFSARHATERGRMNRWNGGVVALLSVLVLAGCASPVVPVTLTPVPVPAASEVGQVVAVVDGDTIDVATEDETVRVRLIRIDTPEIGRGGEASECYADEARTFLDELLYGRQVELISDPTQADTDKYGRLLRHVDIEGLSAAEAAIAAGAGYEYTYDTPYQGQAAYQAAEGMAEEAGTGLWGVCVP